MPGASDQATLVSLGEAGRTKAHRRWLVLRAHLEDGVPLSRVAAQSGIPYRTLQPWLARYRADASTGGKPTDIPVTCGGSAGSWPRRRVRPSG
jgi:Homeodomain-like domain